MTESMPVTELPNARPSGCPFDPPAEYLRLQAERPLTRLSLPDGHQGWLATGYAQVRAILGDRRFSSRYELLHLPGMGELSPAPAGDMSGIDPPGHTRYRSLLTGKFTVRRMRQLTERAEEITTEYLDAMARQDPPVDLVREFAQPVPAMMICELLGVPYADRGHFHHQTEVVMGPDASPEDIGAAYAELGKYVHGLVLAKRANPTDDLLSDLTTSDLTDEELAGVGTFLLGAGLDTTTNQVALSVLALLRNPSQLAALRADPSLIETATEELLRYLSIAHMSAKAALEDVEVDGQVIKAGETVILAAGAANRDPAKFADPDTLDVRRQATGHLAFFHGIHQCLGQHLARVEIHAMLPALLARFPELRLAVAPDEVPMRAYHQVIYGVQRLPVTW